ncbi:hypothetical protein N6H14_15645 [Paenibacillus sp. CC-CFT747]|nr:hypothetical protein N6H14_15645 [Paenibacillus sp. CC-CFT747]
MDNRKGLSLRGVVYDVGTHTRGAAASTREAFDPEVVRQEIRIISRDLQANAIRLTGRDIGRLTLAAEAALAEGLVVWVSPERIDAGEEETLAHYAECAKAMEKLRKKTPKIVFVAGWELSFFMKGLVTGDTAFDRIRTVMNPFRLLMSTIRLGSFHKRLNAFLRKAAAVVREHFHGPLTYASGTWENVDWSLFDYVGMDYYRDKANAAAYRSKLRDYAKHGKPVVVLEFGSCTYTGAKDKGSYGWIIVDRNVTPPRLKGDYERDEEEQAQQLRELLDLYGEEQVYGAFWFTFVMPTYPYDENPAHDLDRASYALVRTLKGQTGTAYPGMPWEPKKAFYALAERYRKG